MFELFVCSLVTWQTVEIYHHSTLFTPVRVYMDQFTGYIGQLHRCMWCLSVWVALVVTLAWRMLYGWHTSNLLYELVSIIGWSLAVSRLANTYNDTLYDYSRTPISGVKRSDIRDIRE